MSNNKAETHWNSVYTTKENQQLGWFESHPETTLQLIKKTSIDKDARILNVGAGTTTLIDTLLDNGYTNLLASDISEVAMQKLQERIVKNYNYNLTCIVDDLTNPKKLNQLQPVDLWIDRAVLHFFLKEEEQKAYFNLVQQLVAPHGYVLIAVFALDGAEKCSGLPLYRYNYEMIQERLGTSFKLVTYFNHTYINPFGGERPYVFTLFKKV